MAIEAGSQPRQPLPQSRTQVRSARPSADVIVLIVDFKLMGQGEDRSKMVFKHVMTDLTYPLILTTCEVSQVCIQKTFET